MNDMKTKTYERYITPKTKAGGMSANRYQRLRDAQLNVFYGEAAEFIEAELFPIIDDVDTIVFGGNTIRAQEFLKKNLLSDKIKEKISDEMIPTSMVNDDGIEEAKRYIPDIIKDSHLGKEREAWDSFLMHLAKETGKAAYGKEIEEHVVNGRVYQLLVHETYQLKYLPDEYNYELVLFSVGSPFSAQLLAFGGCVAILRW